MAVMYRAAGFLLTAAALLALPTALYAQNSAGTGNGVLTERTYYIAFHRGSPPDDATIDLLIILRGAPGWATESASRSSGRSSMGPPGSGSPMRLSLRLGKVQFECSYSPNERVLHLGGSQYPLENGNVIIIDRVDEVGGHATIDRPLNLTLPPYSGGPAMAAALRRLPELQKYIR